MRSSISYPHSSNLYQHSSPLLVGMYQQLSFRGRALRREVGESLSFEALKLSAPFGVFSIKLHVSCEMFRIKTGGIHEEPSRRSDVTSKYCIVIKDVDRVSVVNNPMTLRRCRNGCCTLS